jgi:uncharacterized SAM-binding protein YcdF (DUF218 family)
LGGKNGEGSFYGVKMGRMRRSIVVAWIGLAVVVAVLAVPAAVLANYETIPSGDTKQAQFDTIIVLGCPSLPDGSPGLEQRQRVVEGVREYERHIAPRLIMTGGAAHNHFVEAHTMALLAESMGVPVDSVIEEDQAKDTVQNIFYSVALMRAHGWSSAEVVSSPSHLPRTGLILEHWKIAWHTHEAHWPPEYTAWHEAQIYWHEALMCWKLRTEGFKASQYLPSRP